MLTSLKRMIGLPVVWQDRQLGYVERAIPDAQARRLGGVVVRRGLGPARWSPEEHIVLVGEKCMVLRERPQRLPESADTPLRQAYLTNGVCAGEVSDVIVQCRTLALAALEISPGPLYRLLGRCAYADEYCLCAGQAPGRVVVPRLLTWSQLRQQLGEEDEP